VLLVSLVAAAKEPSKDVDQGVPSPQPAGPEPAKQEDRMREQPRESAAPEAVHESLTPISDAMMAEQAAAVRRERDEIQARAVASVYRPPLPKAPVIVAPVDSPWPDRQPEVSELVSMDAADLPPAGLYLLQSESRRRLTALALALLRFAPSGAPLARRGWIHSHAGAVLSALADGRVLSGLDAHTTEFLEGFIQDDPLERDAWKDVQADVRQALGMNGATPLISAMATRLDRPGPDVIAMIRSRIAAAFAALREKLRSSEDAQALTPQAKELLKAKREAAK
jgi:hypothetical protein